MVFSEELAERVRSILDEKRVQYTTKNMFGGHCFMINNKMALGLLRDKKDDNRDKLMCRCDKTKQGEYLELPHVTPMDFTGRALSGFLYINEEGISSKADLEKWVTVGEEFATSDTKQAPAGKAKSAGGKSSSAAGRAFNKRKETKGTMQDKKKKKREETIGEVEVDGKKQKRQKSSTSSGNRVTRKR
mmetsp:Transcript_13342/g.21859  ORF Transcript_13342/g.21859 Transcript_13342/m.21859 type:complete len:188 (-) Transcript_13342:828-1391(-)